jgi:hypothetical protein
MRRIAKGSMFEARPGGHRPSTPASISRGMRAARSCRRYPRSRKGRGTLEEIDQAAHLRENELAVGARAEQRPFFIAMSSLMKM